MGSLRWKVLVSSFGLWLVGVSSLVFVDERETSANHKFYTSLEDGNPPEDEDVSHS